AVLSCVASEPAAAGARAAVWTPGAGSGAACSPVAPLAGAGAAHSPVRAPVTGATSSFGGAEAGPQAERLDALDREAGSEAGPQAQEAVAEQPRYRSLDANAWQGACPAVRARTIEPAPPGPPGGGAREATGLEELSGGRRGRMDKRKKPAQL